jgi:hypothetical protein
VQAAGNTSALQWLLLGVLSPRSHETRHLVLSELDLTATKGREADVGDLGLAGGGRHGEGFGGRGKKVRREEGKRWDG